MNEKKRRDDERHYNIIPEWTKEQKEKQAKKDFISFIGKKARQRVRYGKI